jgi:hypothetical protein
VLSPDFDKEEHNGVEDFGEMTKIRLKKEERPGKVKEKKLLNLKRRSEDQ